MFKTKQVSNSKVKTVKVTKDAKPIKGEDWFPTRYPNIFALAKKNSGKTTVVSNILDRCSGKQTKFLFICSTIDKDASWMKIVEKWSKTHEVGTFHDIMDDGVNIIQQFIDDQREDDDSEDEMPQINGSQIEIKPRFPVASISAPVTIQEKGAEPKKPPNRKVIYPDYIIVCDDLGDGMRNKALTQLLKTNRHYKTMVILSSQDLNDLLPAARKQLDYVLVFGRQSKEKMQELYDNLKLDIEFNDFWDMYQDATSQQFQFLYISRAGKEDEFRKGFTEKFLLQ
jgi:hypothetical protein